MTSQDKPIPAECNGACLAYGDKCRCDKGALSDRAVMQQALEALETVEVGDTDVLRVAHLAHYAIEALRAALATPAPAPAQGATGPVDDFGRPIVYDTEAIDSVTHALTGDDGEDDSVTVLQRMAQYVAKVWPGQSALQVLMQFEEMLTAPAQGEPPARGPLTSARLKEVCAGIYLSDHGGPGTQSYDEAIARAVERAHGIGAEPPADPVRERLVQALRRLDRRGYLKEHSCAGKDGDADLAFARAALAEAEGSKGC